MTGHTLLVPHLTLITSHTDPTPEASNLSSGGQRGCQGVHAQTGVDLNQAHPCQNPGPTASQPQPGALSPHWREARRRQEHPLGARGKQPHSPVVGKQIARFSRPRGRDSVTNQDTWSPRPQPDNPFAAARPLPLGTETEFNAGLR